MLSSEQSQTERVMEIVDFFSNCYNTGDLCTTLWIFTVFVQKMKEGTRQFTEKYSVLEFQREEDGEKVSCFVGSFLAFGFASLTRVLHLFKKWRKQEVSLSLFSIPISSITFHFVLDYRLSSVFLLGSLLGFLLCVGLLFNFTSSLYCGGKWRINILHLLLNCFRGNVVFLFFSFLFFLKANDTIHILNVGNALYDQFDFGPLLI